MKKKALLLPVRVPLTPRRHFSGDRKPAAKAAKKETKGETEQPAEPPLEGQIEPPPEPEIPDHREDIQAPHKFGPEEISHMNVDLRAALNQIELLQAQKKAAVQDFGLRIQNETNRAKMLRTKLDSGEETRALRAAVAFDAKRGVKRYIHPETGAEIREEPMQPADWQLPMFRPKPDGTEAPATPGAPDVTENKSGKSKPSTPPKTSPAGETSVGDALDSAAAKTKAPQFLLDIDKDDWEAKALTNAFKKAAKEAGWSAPQISALNDRLKECETVEAMIATLRPFVIEAAPPVTTEGAGEELGDVEEQSDSSQSADRGTEPTNPQGLPLVEMDLEPGFTAERVVGLFRKAAIVTGWPSEEIERVASEASFAATSVHDEPEASEAAIKVLAPHIHAGQDQ